MESPSICRSLHLTLDILRLLNLIQRIHGVQCIIGLAINCHPLTDAQYAQNDDYFFHDTLQPADFYTPGEIYLHLSRSIR